MRTLKFLSSGTQLGSTKGVVGAGRESRFLVSRFDGHGESIEMPTFSEPVRLGKLLDSRLLGNDEPGPAMANRE